MCIKNRSEVFFNNYFYSGSIWLFLEPKFGRSGGPPEVTPPLFWQRNSFCPFLGAYNVLEKIGPIKNTKRVKIIIKKNLTYVFYDKGEVRNMPPTVGLCLDHVVEP